LLPDLTIATVAVHEWFHAFVDTALSQRNEAPATGFRALEEAAADRLALDWLRSQDALPADDRSALEKALFEACKAAKMPGYGEYDKVDARVAGTVPELVKEPATLPEDYYVQAAAQPWLGTPRVFQNQILWNGLLAGLEGETVPCYVELGGYLK
jgi:hypothetical protein